MKKENLLQLIQLLNDFMVEYNGEFFGYNDLGKVEYVKLLEVIIKINNGKRRTN